MASRWPKHRTITLGFSNLNARNAQNGKNNPETLWAYNWPSVSQYKSPKLSVDDHTSAHENKKYPLPTPQYSKPWDSSSPSKPLIARVVRSQIISPQATYYHLIWPISLLALLEIYKSPQNLVMSTLESTKPQLAANSKHMTVAPRQTDKLSLNLTIPVGMNAVLRCRSVAARPNKVTTRPNEVAVGLKTSSLPKCMRLATYLVSNYINEPLYPYTFVYAKDTSIS